jgi:hypothetical protein
VNLAFDQSQSIRLIPNQIQSVKFVMTVPSGETPEKTGDFWFTMTAQNDTSRTLTEAITIQASMISNALIELNIDEDQTTLISSGERVEIQYTITNQATRQDSFDLTVDYTPAIGWIIEEEQRPPIVINPGASTSFFIAVTAPNNAQANDVAPTIKPILTSTRSGTQYDGPEYSNVMIETVYDVGLTVLSTESVLKPGGTTVIELEVSNHGNGPSSATVQLMDAPTSWSYSVRLDGVILETADINLGVTYTGNNIERVELLLYVPMSEAAGEFHSVKIAVQPEGEDINPNDNQATIDMITGSIKFPEFNGSILDYHAMVDSTVSLNGTITNVGNALESSMDVGFELSTSPPTSDVIAFLTAGIGGPTSESGEVLTFPMSAGSEKLIFIDVVIGENVPLNTRIVITIFIEGGINDEGEIVKLEHQNLITVDQQRKIEMELSDLNNQTIDSVGTLWFNMTSYSTQSEDVTYSILYPNEWQVMCDGTLIVDGEGNNVSLPYARNTEAIKDIRCEIQNRGDTYIGDVSIVATTIDGAIEYTDSRTFEFTKPDAEESIFSQAINGPTLVASIMGVVILAAILFILRKQRTPFVEEETFVSGPPISQQTNVETTTPTSVTEDVPSGPPLPEDGLPAGWSMEQWIHYGQQYLDRLGKQP